MTKTHSVEEILPLSELGVQEIGENRVQEIVEKWPDLQEKFRFTALGGCKPTKLSI